ncbi:MAG TPA: TIGR03619 family F420-dependent LLM class oxidoreductase, partial [Acidimicrobiia bacterium]
MKLSVTISGLTRLYGDDLAAMVDTARVADAAGVDELVLPDHVVMSTRLDRYPFGRFPYGSEEPWLEPLTALAAFAGATERIRLSTGVLIAPLRPATLLAKTAATLDVLSRGRLDLGVGTGWQPEEYEAEGVPFEGRVARLDDTIRACRALWTDEPPVSFASPTVSFTDLWCEPRPVQPGGIPVSFGGGANTATARRVAGLGAGWLPIGVTPHEELAKGIALIRDACAAVGRDPATVGVRAGLAVATSDDGSVDLDRTLAAVPALAELG